MKNHWLDKKIDKEIDAAFEQIVNLGKDIFKDSDPIELPGAQDLSAVMNRDGPGTRYKEYDRLNLKADDQFDFGVDLGVEEHDRAVVVEILLKYKDKPHWIDEVLTDIRYMPAPDPFGNITLDTSNLDTNFTITLGDKWPDLSINTNTVTAGTEDLPGWKDGVIVDMDVWKGKCEKCGEYQWPMNDENTMTQGDPSCACYNSCGNLDIFYADKFIQNEKVDHLSTKLDTNSNDHSQYQVMYTPILPGTMTGTIHWDAECNWGWVFSVSSAGDFDIRRFDKDENGKVRMIDGQLGETLSDQECMEKLANGEMEMPWYDNIYYATLNPVTGILDIHHNRGDAPNVIISYEVDSL